jgi:hypothetical protein
LGEVLVDELSQRQRAADALLPAEKLAGVDEREVGACFDPLLQTLPVDVSERCSHEGVCPGGSPD